MSIWTSGEHIGSGGVDHHPFFSNSHMDRQKDCPSEITTVSLADIASFGGEIVKQSVIRNESGGFDEVSIVSSPNKYRADLPA